MASQTKLEPECSAPTNTQVHPVRMPVPDIVQLDLMCGLSAGLMEMPVGLDVWLKIGLETGPECRNLLNGDGLDGESFCMCGLFKLNIH